MFSTFQILTLNTNIFAIFSHSTRVSGTTLTLELEMISWVFYHYATVAVPLGINFIQSTIYLIITIKMKEARECSGNFKDQLRILTFCHFISLCQQSWQNLKAWSCDNEVSVLPLCYYCQLSKYRLYMMKDLLKHWSLVSE